MTSIVYKSLDLVIVCKDAGTPSQSDKNADIDALTECRRALREEKEGDILYLIHRLDRVVGGLLIFARTKEAAGYLSWLVSSGDIRKEYLAVIEGRPESSCGELSDFIYKDSVLGKAFVTNDKKRGKPAILQYTVLETITYKGRIYSLISVILKTGRFHQIRTQFSTRGMPIVGDGKYGSRDSFAKMPSLFAKRLSFKFNGEEIDVKKSPDKTLYPWSLFSPENYK